MSKIDQAMPTPPIAEDITALSIKWVSDNGSIILYNGLEKPSGSIWNGLIPNKAYEVTAYFPETETHYRSPYSPISQATTLSDKIGQVIRSAATPIVQQVLFKPVAYDLNIDIIDGFKVGNILRLTYTYNDSDNTLENGSIATWYIADTEIGPWEELISIECNSNIPVDYIIKTNDLGKFIRASVLPKNGNEPRTNINIGEMKFTYPTPMIVSIPTKPIASNAVIMKLNGNIKETIDETNQVKNNDSIIGVFDYFDINQEQQGNHIFKWYRSLANNTNGSWETIIVNGSEHNSISYTTREADIDRYIRFEITPVSISNDPDTTIGETIWSEPIQIIQGPLDPNIKKITLIGMLRDKTNAGYDILNNVEWIVENETIGKIENGYFIPLTDGETMITAKIQIRDGSYITSSAIVSVGDLMLDRIIVSERRLSVVKGTLIDIFTK